MSDFIPLDVAVEIISSDTDSSSFEDKFMVHDSLLRVDDVPEPDEEDPEELQFDSDNDHVLALPPAALAASSDGYEEFCSGEDSDGGGLSDSAPPSADARPDCLDVFMPPVNVEHFNNLAYVYAHPTPPPPPPPASSPAFFIRRVLRSHDFHPTASLRPSSQGAALVCFGSHFEQEFAVHNSPYIGREHTVYLNRHNDTQNRFLFDNRNLAALSMIDYLLEHWFPAHILTSTAPFANPFEIDPICISGVDYSQVLVIVQARSLSVIPRTLAVHGSTGEGTITEVHIIHSQDLDPVHENNPFPPPSGGSGGSGGSNDGFDSDGSGGGDFPVFTDANLAPPLPPVVNSSNFAGRVVQMPGGLAMMASPRPFMRATPLDAKPRDVSINLFPGFYDVHVTGTNGEHSFYRLPMQVAGSRGLLVANLATCTIGHLTKISLVGPLKQPMTSVEVICRDTESFSLVSEPPLSLEDANLLLLQDVMPAEPAPSPVVPHRSARLASIEPATYTSILDKVSGRKKLKMEGGLASASTKESFQRLSFLKSLTKVVLLSLARTSFS
ncbi:hypothetical protein BRADI_2g27406v3 [Brachypodium distachyon]|nr:hypothetical protein BRADI_2g27406v3 [Brachypodium distachyon]